MGLFLLMKLEGFPADLASIRDALPGPHPRGYSMKELREAAGRGGLRLTGIMLRAGTRAPDRPMLALLRRGPHGHYVVVRPVGHTGKLVQIVDSNREPLVMDAADLYASSEWTGFVLTPQRPSWLARAAAALAVVPAFFLIRSLPKLMRWRGQSGGPLRPEIAIIGPAPG